MSIDLIPAVYQGFSFEDYYVCKNTHTIWSNKWGKLKPMSMPKQGKSPYPKMKFTENGQDIMVFIHKVIAETLLPFPPPSGITKKEWKETPESVKQLVKSMYLVNHIDHDKYNYSLNNLEWVTFTGNARAYQEHSRKVQ